MFANYLPGTRLRDKSNFRKMVPQHITLRKKGTHHKTKHKPKNTKIVWFLKQPPSKIIEKTIRIQKHIRKICITVFRSNKYLHHCHSFFVCWAPVPVYHGGFTCDLILFSHRTPTLLRHMASRNHTDVPVPRRRFELLVVWETSNQKCVNASMCCFGFVVVVGWVV